MAWALREAKCAHRFGALVLIRHEEVVQTGVSNILHEPFANSVACISLYITQRKGRVGLGGGEQAVRDRLTYRVPAVRLGR